MSLCPLGGVYRTWIISFYHLSVTLIRKRSIRLPKSTRWKRKTKICLRQEFCKYRISKIWKSTSIDKDLLIILWWRILQLKKNYEIVNVYTYQDFCSTESGLIQREYRIFSPCLILWKAWDLPCSLSI